MKARDLIKALQALDPDMDVRVAEHYGDHIRTITAFPIRSVDTVELVWSPYHDTFVLPSENAQAANYETETAIAIVIR